MNKLVYDSAPFESVRSVDDNGFLHVAVSNVTKEQVVPYAGDEIPDSEAHGFEADKVYYGYRPASELSKESTIKSLNGIPILLNHHADFADEPQKKYRVGSTGTDAEFDAPYLKNSLHITDADAIKRINDGSMKEISLGYRYTPVFEKGEFEGQKYDFVMTDISCNHVALVERGRAGRDVVVGDADTTETKHMDEAVEKAEVALAENIEDAAQALKDLHDENPDTEEVQDINLTTSDTGETTMEEVENKDAVLEELLKEIADAGLDPEKVKEKIEFLVKANGENEVKEEVKAEDEEVKVEETEKVTEDEDEVEAEEKEEVTLDKVTADACGLDAEDPDIQKAFAEGVKYGERMEKKEPKKLDSEHESEGEERYLAGDSAEKIAALVEKRLDAKYQAIDDCRKTLGNVKAMVFDSAGAVYRAALKREGISTKGMNDAACRATYLAISAATSKKSKLAMDSAAKDTKSALSSYFDKVNVGV